MSPAAFLAASAPLRTSQSNFASPLCARRRPATSPPTRHVAPTMISAPAIATGVIAVGAVGAVGAYFFAFFLREQPSPSPASAAAAASSSDMDVAPRAVLGLASTSLSAPSATMPTSMPAMPAPTPEPERAAPVTPMANLESVGVDLTRFGLEAPATPFLRPIEEEFTWAASALSNLPGYGATVVTDKAGAVCWADGPLVPASASEPGRVIAWAVKTIVGPATGEAFVVEADKMPFLGPEAESVAIIPIGEDGAALLVASTEKDFFGVMEERTAMAVAARLQVAIGAMPKLSA